MSSYTLMLLTPRSPIPSFLAALQESDLKPLSVSKVVGWPSHHPQSLSSYAEWDSVWALFLVLPGENVCFPANERFAFKRFWGMTVEMNNTSPEATEFGPPANEGLKAVPDPPTEEQQPVEGTDKHTTAGKHSFKTWPEVLGSFVKYQPFREGPLMTADWLTFHGETARQCYEIKFQSIVREVNTDVTAEIHVVGKIASSYGEVGGQWAEVGITRYASVDDYANALTSGILREASDRHDMDAVVKELRTLVVRQLILPPQGVAIDRWSWEYGNPYEPHGEDWFG